MSDYEQIDWAKVAQYYNEDKIEHPVVEDALICLSNIVRRTHFNYISDQDAEDLLSEGILKAYMLLRAGRFDVKKGNLGNYLYTGMRNAMTNFLYHKRKLIIVEDVLIEEGNELPNSYISFDRDIISEVISGLSLDYTPYIKPVAFYLKQLGYTVEGFSSLKAPLNIDLKTLEKLLCLVIWKKQEYYL